MKEYLSFYSSNFKYPNNMNKADWENYRTNRIITKKIINISLKKTKVKLKKEKAIVTFTQNYKSGALNQTSPKTLVLVEEDSRWLILEEISK